MLQEFKVEHAYFGGGCFWCIEAIFQNVRGVLDVTNGYSGGDALAANYENVSSGNTNHAEICKITYDSCVISFDNLLEVFFLAHDPTTLNRQGDDVGPQYRSVIFYINQRQKLKSEKKIRKLEKNNVYINIRTELIKFKKFYEAEKYHQSYFKLNPSQPYCSFVIEPKIQKLKKKLDQYSK